MVPAQLGYRFSHVLRRMLPIAMYLLQKEGAFLTGHDLFLKRVGAAYHAFLEDAEVRLLPILTPILIPQAYPSPTSIRAHLLWCNSLHCKRRVYCSSVLLETISCVQDSLVSMPDSE